MTSRQPDPGDYQVRLVGAPRTPLRDFYYGLMRLSWPATLLVVSGGYLAVNVLFALLYRAGGGIAHARADSLADAFYFSIQTMGTIGYGSMFPETPFANALVTIESTLGLVLTALATGLVFAKFSRPSARLMFSRWVTVSPMNGVPTLSFRIGNQRSNRIVEARIRLALVRTEVTTEGETFYRTIDLKLGRDRALSLARAWTVLHTIDESSPLHGQTAESLRSWDAELLVTVSGTDDIWMQTVHGSKRYFDHEIKWGYRHSDIIRDGGHEVVLDLSRFHEVEPTRS